MTKKQKKTLRRILSSTVLFAVVWAVTALASLPPWWEFLLYLLPYALIGWDILCSETICFNSSRNCAAL